MESHWSALLVTCALFCCLLPVPAFRRDKPITKCQNGRQLCRTSVKYRDGYVADEGLQCKCEEEDDLDNSGESRKCPKDWSDQVDASTLTWQHYEKGYLQVQYRFCEKVFQGNVCEPGELAAVVDTDLGSWRPYINKPRCVCPDGQRFKLRGWKRSSKVWEYQYYCDVPECLNPKDAPVVCANVYINPSRRSDMVNEIVFPCRCPEGYLCNPKFDEKEDLKNVTSDGSGKKLVRKYCDEIKKMKKG